MYLDKLRLDGRRAVVTGGARAIGLACCQALAEAGAEVVIADIDQAVAAEGQATLTAAGFRHVSIIHVDVTRRDSMLETAERIENERGPVDILVCCAGVARSGVAAEDVSEEHWRAVLDLNLDGVFWSCQAFGKPMLERKRGAIVNIGSMSACIVNKPQKQSYYNASKAAVHHLTKSLAAEWADRGVRVNAVAPTYIDTPMTRFGMEDERMYKVWLENTPMGRVGQPHEIASVVHFLASDAASLMTGSIVLADGGYCCW